MKKEFICIVCPQSCHLTVTKIGDELRVEGYSCKRGIKYGKMEFSSPKRLLSTTISILEGVHRRLPVMSMEEIEKDKIMACLDELYKIEIKAPVACGSIIADNIAGTGVKIIASRSMNKKGE